MKIMGLDVGSKTVGVAISDALGWTAQGMKRLKSMKRRASSVWRIKACERTQCYRIRCWVSEKHE